LKSRSTSAGSVNIIVICMFSKSIEELFIYLMFLWIMLHKKTGMFLSGISIERRHMNILSRNTLKLKNFFRLNEYIEIELFQEVRWISFIRVF
jgi:hypothetical protein